jgi:hypothetical protein
MHPIEEKILSLIEENAYISLDCKNKLYALPLGKLSQEFYTDIRVKTYCTQKKERRLAFRLALEEYITSDRSQQYLENIETAILKLPSPMSSLGSKGLQNKAAGTYLMPISSELIRQVYQLEDMPLSNLFQKHFPTPSTQLFERGSIPDVIQKRSAAVLETMNKIDMTAIEPFILKVQRRVRMKKRHQEEIYRIAQRDEFYLKSQHMSIEELEAIKKTGQTPKQIHQWAEELLQDANTPYKPKCDPILSDRIMSAAEKVAAFSTVKHITSVKAIQSIFDEALYGRRTLMDFYLGFDPAALHASDVLNGDGNVACLGPQDIDPKALGGIIIEFDLPKLIQNKPSAFYKQRDLEYQVDKVRQVQLGKETISFDHTGFVRCAEQTSAYLSIVDGRWGDLKQIAEAPKSSFISYNLEQMHEILALNFFRFMDRMSDLEGRIDQTYIDDFYRKLALLTEEELVLFLTELEKNMTDTAEFNFYGAHQIDFSTIQNITARYKKYTLNLPKFIHDLKHGNIDELRQARIKIPELFQSYRFLDYLLLQLQDSEAKYYLDDLRKQCKTPNWVKYTPLLVPEQFELCWELHSDKPEVLVAVEVEKEEVPLTIMEPSTQIPIKVHQEVLVKTASEKQGSAIVPQTKIDPVPEADLTPKLTHEISESLSVITEEPVQDDSFNKELQTHREQFDILIGKLEEFSSYCGSSNDNTIILYQPFVQGLKKDFAEIVQNFFSEAHIRDKETLKRSFEIFKSECERLSQKAENHFKHNAGIWSYVKPILTGFVGVIIAIAATLLTLGIATYYVAKNEPLRSQYIDTFFKSEPRAIQDLRNKWTQYSIKQNLFGDEGLANNGLLEHPMDESRGLFAAFW